MEETILRELASHGTASWFLGQLLFLAGLAALFGAAIQTGSQLILVGVVLVSFGKAVDQRRLTDPDDPRPSWLPWA